MLPNICNDCAMAEFQQAAMADIPPSLFVKYILFLAFRHPSLTTISWGDVLNVPHRLEVWPKQELAFGMKELSLARILSDLLTHNMLLGVFNETTQCSVFLLYLSPSRLKWKMKSLKWRIEEGFACGSAEEGSFLFHLVFINECSILFFLLLPVCEQHIMQCSCYIYLIIFVVYFYLLSLIPICTYW